MSDSAFPQTPQNTVKRLPKRGAYDHETVYSILDANLLCHVAFVQEDQPYIIPTLYAREEDTLYLHGASTSRMLAHAESGAPLCIAVTEVNALVLARSVFNHSVNYRSVVAFGRGRLVRDEAEKMRGLTYFTEKLLPGRWQDVRPPNPVEMKATALIAVELETASAKIRTGDPKDEPEDVNLPIWAGLLPLRQGYEAPQPSADNRSPLPAYLLDFVAPHNG
jgi:nitroimidazol reductase NimA-like FMN-containing flavoprotein (pyridoxamine 5'-phosphate oxidase superfamily)